MSNLDIKNNGVNSTERLNLLLSKASMPGCMARMSLEERKFLLAALLASVVPLDRKVKTVELDKLQEILEARYKITGTLETMSVSLASCLQLTEDDMRRLGQLVSELLSMDDCCALIGQMWEIALSDHQLHTTEESMINRFSAYAGIPKKRVLEEQTKASGKSPV